MYHLFVTQDDGTKNFLIDAPDSDSWPWTLELAQHMYGKENISYTWVVDTQKNVV